MTCIEGKSRSDLWEYILFYRAKTFLSLLKGRFFGNHIISSRFSIVLMIVIIGRDNDVCLSKGKNDSDYTKGC